MGCCLSYTLNKVYYTDWQQIASMKDSLELMSSPVVQEGNASWLECPLSCCVMACPCLGTPCSGVDPLEETVVYVQRATHAW